MKNQIHQNILCALFVALTAVCSQIIIPIQPVPITLGTLPAFLSGVILGKNTEHSAWWYTFCLER